MKFTTDRKVFHDALAVVARAVSTRSTLPILSNILLQAGAGAVRLAATDLELAVERIVEPMSVDEPGQLTVPAKTLTDLVSQLTDGKLTLAGDDKNTAVLTSGRNRYQLLGLPPEEFPSAPEVGAGGGGFERSERDLHRLLRYVEPALSEDDTRPTITAASLTVTVDALQVVATDTHRLAVISGSVQAAREGSILLPRRAVQELLRLLDRDSAASVRVRFDENQVLVQSGAVSLVSRLVAGQFPKWAKFVPTGHTAAVTVPVAEMQQAVKRASIVARENANRLVLRVDAETLIDTLVIEAQAGGLGQAREEVAVDVEGQPPEVCLNVRYLLETLAVHERERVAVEYSGGSLAPLVMRDAGEAAGGFTVLMPIHLT